MSKPGKPLPPRQSWVLDYVGQHPNVAVMPDFEDGRAFCEAFGDAFGKAPLRILHKRLYGLLARLRDKGLVHQSPATTRDFSGLPSTHCNEYRLTNQGHATQGRP